MKIIPKLLLIVTVAVATFSSCSKSNELDFERAREEQRIQDSINRVRIERIVKEQAPAVKAFADKNLLDAKLDTATGIWFQLIQAGDEASYTYKVLNNQLVAPTITAKYKGTLLDGTIFDATEGDKSFVSPLNNVIGAWQLAFLPKTIRFNGEDYKVGGLTANGLKKGAKIKIVTPSPWAYDEQASAKIPANSPLYFEFDVVDVK
ncbi:FKBP-type peptidyl-prolyl cis-trans isomerase [Sphingobacterium deserti]|uniref:Peptidyl-prolyl cis-trans isomerase n=1 Tax=Sphingobacterium deserti TaxID=1229276 RepID=A0A0B8TAQ9_9SPHI|nr:FKBP-type peptidyl-prolyl cis-trans isomerase [Sphingobacterium deserti]KGE15185.1 FKBP-type peptidyl-prolyl cis-trans isomerase FkpA [Sphingobacterium deserti]